MNLLIIQDPYEFFQFFLLLNRFCDFENNTKLYEFWLYFCNKITCYTQEFYRDSLDFFFGKR